MRVRIVIDDKWEEYRILQCLPPKGDIISLVYRETNSQYIVFDIRHTIDMDEQTHDIEMRLLPFPSK